MFNWGIIGPGRIAHKFAYSVGQLDDAKILAVASHNQEKASSFAKEYSIPMIFDNYEKMAQCKDIDAIYIATINPYHHQPAILCLNNKKPVLLEKPLALNSKFTQEMIDTATYNKTFFMEAMWTRFLPAMVEVRKWLEQGLIGKVRNVKASFSFKFDGDPEDRWLNLEQGGGALLDLGIYPLSFTCMVLGTDYKDISTSGSLASTGVDEHCSITLTYDNGCIGQVYCSISTLSPNDAYIIGTEGYIKIKSFFEADNAQLIKNGEVVKSISFDYYEDAFKFEAMEVQKLVESDKLQSEILPLEESLKIMKIIDIAKENMGLKYPQE